MKREREINLLRKRKRLIKKYSDFELGLLASEINDYTYLLKSIKFPIDKYKLPQSKKEKEKEKEENENSNINDNKDKKIIPLEEIYEDINKNKEDKENEEEKESDEEYKGLKARGIKQKNKRKRI